jgi:hypothetical protein
MIAIGVHGGGPELKDSPIDKMLTRSMSAAMRKRDTGYKNGVDGWINPIFIIPGSVSKPDFEGYKLGHFSKKERGLVIQIEVPQSVADGDGVKEFVAQSLREAVRLAAAYFSSKGVSFSTLKAERIILGIESVLEDAPAN